MEITLQQAGFAFLAAVILVFSVLTVTTKRILRAATYLLFVLFATAGIYFQLNYSFLGAVQLLIYAGGVVVLYVFSILLTSSDEERKASLRNGRIGGRPRRRAGRRCADAFPAADPLVRSFGLYGRGDRHAPDRAYADGNREIPISAAFRGGQRAVAGLHRRRAVNRT